MPAAAVRRLVILHAEPHMDSGLKQAEVLRRRRDPCAAAHGERIAVVVVRVCLGVHLQHRGRAGLRREQLEGVRSCAAAQVVIVCVCRVGKGGIKEMINPV